MAVLAVGAVASTGPPPATQARRASHRLLARPQALPVATQWPVVRASTHLLGPIIWEIGIGVQLYGISVSLSDTVEM